MSISEGDGRNLQIIFICNVSKLVRQTHTTKHNKINKNYYMLFILIVLTIFPIQGMICQEHGPQIHDTMIVLANDKVKYKIIKRAGLKSD